MNPGLENRRVVNTRAAHQAGAFDEILRAHGAMPLAYPCIAIEPVADTRDFDAALRDLAAGRYHWLALTSSNTVIATEQRLQALRISLAGAAFRTAAIGPSTCDAARERLQVAAELLSEEYVAESLGGSLPVLPGERVLLPESEIARPTLAQLLRERGADVTVIPAYHTVRGRGGVDVPGMLTRGEVDAITFTSTSTVTNFIERVQHEGGRVQDALPVCAACIGPITADTAHNAGFTRIVTPEKYTIAALADALDDFFCHHFTREAQS
ncbi:MAG TPA: uroporphyrinogen-III synthase [Candidatus Krumholzibacteria bacterium]|nr:uroporphyrinogen-III synthase [Candidatus Krumholzibacteria bacterium]